MEIIEEHENCFSDMCGDDCNNCWERCSINSEDCGSDCDNCRDFFCRDFL